MKKPGQSAPRDLSPEDLKKFDCKVKSAIFKTPAGAEARWKAYEATSGAKRVELGRVLLQEHQPQYIPKKKPSLDSDGPRKEDVITRTRSGPEHVLAGVGRQRKRPPDLPAGYVRLPGGHMVPVSAGSEPTLRHRRASDQELHAALALRDLASKVIAERNSDRAGSVSRPAVLRAYESAFGAPSPDRPPWTGVFIRRLTAAKRQLLDLDIAQKLSANSYAEEFFCRQGRVTITGLGSTRKVEFHLPPRGTVEVRSDQIEPTFAPLPGAQVIDQVDASTPKTKLEAFMRDVPGTVIAYTFKSNPLAFRLREQDRDDRAYEAIPQSEIGDDDHGVLLVKGPPRCCRVRITKGDAEPAVWVRLTLDQAVKFRQLEAAQLLRRVRKDLGAWPLLPSYIDDPKVVSWLLVKLSFGRGGGLNGSMSVRTVGNLVGDPDRLAKAIEQDPVGKRNADVKSRCTRIAEGIRTRASRR